MENLSVYLQEGILAIVCFKDVKQARQIQAILPCSLLDPYYKELCNITYNYITKYKDTPKEHTLDIVEALKRKYPKKADIFNHLYQGLLASHEDISFDFVFDKVNDFIKFQNLTKTVHELIDVVEKNSEDSLPLAEQIINNFIKKRYEVFDAGYCLNNTDDALSFLHEDKLIFLPTGIKELDAVDAGPVKGGIHVFQALGGRGKSWWLMNLALEAMKQEKKVLHVSLEMSAPQILKRYMQMLFKVSKRPGKYTHKLFEDSELGLSFIDEIITTAKSLEDPDIEEYLKNNLKYLTRNEKLYVKQFPSNSLTTVKLEAYLDTLADSKNFTPDLLIIDYADLMYKKNGGSDSRFDIRDIYENLRGLATERGVYLATASQANRSAVSVKTLNEENLSEDFSKNFTADTIISYSQTELERMMGLARLDITKSRDDVKTGCLISQNYAIGQFVCDSWPMCPDYWEVLKTNSGLIS